MIKRNGIAFGILLFSTAMLMGTSGICATGIEEVYSTLKSLKESETEETAVRDFQIGEHVFFGSYEQDNNENDGVEPIEWIIMDIEDGSAHIISNYILDGHAFDTNTEGIVTWSYSQIRSWLNYDFRNKAFTESEQEAIENYPDDIEEDIAFLTTEEVSSLRGSIFPVMCKATTYAQARGVWVNTSGSTYDGYSEWWLIDSGEEYGTVKCVGTDGEFFDNRYNDPSNGIRPVLWVKCSALR